jgi:peptidoglycan/xylan/chitin deacetylase (PgdA/CDA1 family)
MVALLRKVFRSGVFALLRLSGLPFLIREFTQHNKVTIIAYHALDAERAETHFAALRKRYSVIALSDFLSTRSDNPTNQLPPKSLIITFDDGHKANHGLASVVQNHRIPITIFLCSGVVGTRRHYWWLHAENAKEAQRLKMLPDEQRVQTLLARGYTDEREYEERQSLSRDEIEEMKPFVDFQSHTVFHPILPACSDERARREIIESKEALETEYGLKVYALAYPNGDYSDREVELVRQSGYSCGVTLDAGSNDSKTDLFRLRRVALPDDAGINEVIVKTSGLWAVLKAFGSILQHRWRGAFCRSFVVQLHQLPGCRSKL